MSNPPIQVGDPEARIDELSLLVHPPPALVPSPSQAQKKVIGILYVIIFMVMFGQYLQPGPRTQIYETIVCAKYYDKLRESLAIGNGTVGVHDCKVKPVQEELALLRGWEKFGDLFPTILTIPYGVLADRYGRRSILFLALFGLLLGEVFGLLVCWFSAIFPIRSIWAQFIFQFIGGGGAVGQTMLNVIVTDVTPQEMRTIAFFRIHGAAIGSAILAPSVGSLLMGYDPFLAWFAAEICLTMGLLLVLLLPKGLGKQVPTSASSCGSEAPEDGASSSGKQDTSIKGRMLGALESLKPVFKVIAANRQLLLIIAMGLFGQLGNDSLLLMLLLVVTNRYGWSFAQANYLFSVNAFIQFLLLMVLLPIASQFLLQRLHVSALRKDHHLVFFSSLVPAVGAFCLGLAPKAGLAVFGVVLMSAGAGFTALVRSLISGITASKNISVAFSVMTILTIVGSSFGGPIYSGTYAAGVRLGPSWVGLPFLVAGVILLVVFCIALFIRETKQGEYETVLEQEEG